MDTKQTSDIYFAAALMALGAKLESTDKTDPRHMIFKLSLTTPQFNSENLKSIGNVTYSFPVFDMNYYEKEWVNGSLLINAVAFKNAIQQMKSVIHTKS